MSYFTYVYDGWKLIDEPRHEGNAALDALQANPHSDGGDRLPGRKRSQYDSYGTEDVNYVNGPGGDEPLTRNPTIGQISYYNQDGNGNVTALTDASDNVIEHYAYDPFGNVTTTSSTGMVMTSSSVENRFLFSGREYIAEIGLYDYRNRVYSPVLGRFLKTDPILFQAGNVNTYRYVGNLPVNGVDLNGELSMFQIGAYGAFTAMAAQIILNILQTLIHHCPDPPDNSRDLSVFPNFNTGGNSGWGTPGPGYKNPDPTYPNIQDPHGNDISGEDPYRRDDLRIEVP